MGDLRFDGGEARVEGGDRKILPGRLSGVEILEKPRGSRAGEARSGEDRIGGPRSGDPRKGEPRIINLLLESVTGCGGNESSNAGGEFQLCSGC